MKVPDAVIPMGYAYTIQKKAQKASFKIWEVVIHFQIFESPTKLTEGDSS